MAEADAGEKLKVFISYSRKDSAEFADELLAGLEVAGFAPFLDRHDIVPGERWEARLGDLIEQSDTVVFVVSPEAVKSERCVWEVDRTIGLSKRLLPVIFQPVPEHDIPEKLRRLQFVRFDGGAGFTRPLSQLAEALRVDLHWIREHTRLGELATRWDGEDVRNRCFCAGMTSTRQRPGWPPERRQHTKSPMRSAPFVRASEAAEIARFVNERGQLHATARGSDRPVVQTHAVA
jgi:TIR domain